VDVIGFAEAVCTFSIVVPVARKCGDRDASGCTCRYWGKAENAQGEFFGF